MSTRKLSLWAKPGESFMEYIDRCIATAQAAEVAVRAEHNGKRFVVWPDERTRLQYTVADLGNTCTEAERAAGVIDELNDGAMFIVHSQFMDPTPSPSQANVMRAPHCGRLRVEFTGDKASLTALHEAAKDVMRARS